MLRLFVSLLCVIYSIHAISQTNCSAKITSMKVTGSEIICNDQTDSTSIVLQFTPGFGPYEVTISNGPDSYTKVSVFAPSTTIFVNKIGIYEITDFKTSSTDCSSFDNVEAVNVSQRILPTISFKDNQTKTICANTTETASLVFDIPQGNPPYRISYSDGTQNNNYITSASTDSLKNLKNAGNYSLLSIEDEFCKGSVNEPSQATVSVKQPSNPVLSTTNEIICEEDSLQLSVSNIGNGKVTGWVVNNSEIVGTEDMTFFTYLASGVSSKTNIYVKVKDSSCTSLLSSDTANIIVRKTPKVIIQDTIVNIGQTITLNGMVDPDSAIVSWTPTLYMTAGMNSISPTLSIPFDAIEETREYGVTALLNDCISKATISIIITRDLFVFNSFSPNGDQINDTWTIYGIEKYPNMTINVFNRYGQKVFASSKGYTEKWRGDKDGKALPVGTYYYVIDLGDSEVENSDYTGSVTIVK